MKYDSSQYMGPRLWTQSSSSKTSDPGLLKKAGGVGLSGLAWVGDKLSYAQYAATGILAGKGAKWGIDHKYTPSFAMGIENPWAAFAVDVVYDPLNLVGIGAMTKIGAVSKLGKAGKGGRAATLYGQAVKNQRAFLTLDVPFVKELQGIRITPQALDKAIFGAMTKGTEYAKQFTQIKIPAFGKAYKPLGFINDAAQFVRARPALQGLSDFSLKNIEQKASKLDEVFRTSRNVEIDQAGYVAKQTARLNATIGKINSALGKVKVKRDVVVSQLLRRVEDGVSEVPEGFEPIAKELRDLADEVGADFRDAGGGVLEGKVLPKVVKGTADLETAGFMRAGSKASFPARVRGGASASSKFDKYTEFVNGAGKSFGGRSSTRNRAALENGLDLVEVEDGVYMFKKVLDAIDNGKKHLPKVISQLEKRLAKNAKAPRTVASQLRAKIILEQLRLLRKVKDTLSIEAFKAIAPEQFFKRAAATTERSTEIAKNLGREAVTYEQDVTKVAAVHIARTGKEMARKQFVEGMKKIGIPHKGKAPLPAGYQKSTLPELSKYAFPEEVIKHIDESYNNYTSLEGIGRFYEMFIKAHNLWKTQLTIVNPAFHARNMVSNLWNLHLAGAYDPRAFAKSAAVMWGKRLQAWKQNKTIFEVLDRTDRKYYSEFVSQGLGGTGRFTAEFEGVFSAIQRTKALRTAQAFGAANEDFAKYALYLQRRNSGMGVAEAASEVRKYLFDYSDLSQLEKQYAKNVFSFYTWTRKNIPLQVAMLIQKPGKVNDLNALKLAFERNAEGEPMEDKYLPEWLRDGYDVYIGRTPEGMEKYIKLEGFLPTVDLDSFLDPHQGAGLIKNGVNGIFTTLWDLLNNTDSFSGRDIREYSGQKKLFFGIPVPPEVEYTLSKIRPLNDLQKAFGMNDQEKIASAKERTWQFIIGKIYTYDEATQIKYFQYLQSYQLGEVKKDMEKALSKGDVELYQNLQQALIKIQNGEGLAL